MPSTRWWSSLEARPWNDWVRDESILNHFLFLFHTFLIREMPFLVSLCYHAYLLYFYIIDRENQTRKDKVPHKFPIDGSFPSLKMELTSLEFCTFLSSKEACFGMHIKQKKGSPEFNYWNWVSYKWKGNKYQFQKPIPTDNQDQGRKVLGLAGMSAVPKWNYWMEDNK